MSIQNQSSRPPASSSRTLLLGSLRQAVGQQAARAARADDDVVEAAEVLHRAVSYRHRKEGGLDRQLVEALEARRGGAFRRRSAPRATTPRSHARPSASGWPRASPSSSPSTPGARTSRRRPRSGSTCSTPAVLRDAPELTGARSVRDVEGVLRAAAGQGRRPRLLARRHRARAAARQRRPSTASTPPPMKRSAIRASPTCRSLSTSACTSRSTARAAPRRRCACSTASASTGELEEAARAYVRATVRVKDARRARQGAGAVPMVPGAISAARAARSTSWSRASTNRRSS